MRSEAATVKEYLDELPEDRRKAIKKVRQVIRKKLPAGYREVMNWGMITYEVPLKTCPDTYNGQPLMYAALASQKNHMGVYLTGIYMDEKRRKKFEAAYKKTGKRMDVGESCVRFRKLEDLPLELIGKSIASIGIDRFINGFKSLNSARNSKK
jgi:uncharacterized protein YdhG (YjbR/CyaY superfamily)